MDSDYIFFKVPPKHHLCEIISKLDKRFRRSCNLSQLLMDGRTDDKDDRRQPMDDR